VPKVRKVKGTKMTITCFGPVFIGLKIGFPILSKKQLFSILTLPKTLSNFGGSSQRFAIEI